MCYSEEAYDDYYCADYTKRQALELVTCLPDMKQLADDESESYNESQSNKSDSECRSKSDEESESGKSESYDESESNDESESSLSFIPSEEKESSWNEFISINTNSDFCNQELNSLGSIFEQADNGSIASFETALIDFAQSHNNILYIKRPLDYHIYCRMNHNKLNIFVIIKRQFNKQLRREELSFCEYFLWENPQENLCIKYTYIIALSQETTANDAMKKILSFQGNIGIDFSARDCTHH